jgi:hypothetical protein
VSHVQLVVHGHFYQPPRIDPFSGRLPPDPTAAPARDWNERVSQDCYRPNAVLGNLGATSWDLGPTLAEWLVDGDPTAYRGFVDGDAGVNGMAQPYHHAILPLASDADRRTEIRWGIRDFELRFGRRPRGLWLPETAVDAPTLRMLVAEGITHTILAPWQVDGHGIDTRRPVRVELGAGRSIVAVLYDGLLSAAVSFEPAATVDADRFVRERLLPRGAEAPDALDGSDPLIVIASDGELYGHHQPLREHFLARLVGRTAPADRPYATPSLTDALDQRVARGLPTARLRERTSWSCHHGVTRWRHGCACVVDGSWKDPLRSALDRLAGGIDAVSDQAVRGLPTRPDPWAARDAWADVVVGARSATDVAGDWLGDRADASARAVFTTVMEAQRWRLAMFASCAWFWDRPDRVETAGTLRAATRAARLMDGLAGTDLEARLIADLAHLEFDGVDGVDLLGAALSSVGVPARMPSDRSSPGNPSARGLRATG